MILECVPNFSEGRRPDVVEAIARSAEIPGVRVLGIAMDADHNRSVMTAVGEAEDLSEAMFRAARTAVEYIDLRVHQGTHPRMGAVDVMPFVPLVGATMENAVQVAEKLGRRMGKELQLPVYLYEMAATKSYHKNLADVRRGQFEGLSSKMANDPPDFGPAYPHPTAGAVAVGARNPLIAFNVLLNTDSMDVAGKVAESVRGSTGGLIGVKALPMNTVSQGKVQVSMNLVDYPKTPLPRALEMVREEAGRWGVSIFRTELVGFMPAQALVDTARYYLQQFDFELTDVLEWALCRPQEEDQGRELS
ncbi:MAG: glutamate formimidoyltransferase [Firmicutes bacterium]|jgi:glutamate formiminotransferase|uniref:glutamate formimidoyltransferase n=1 Tax=Sulfobacillus benefaciens TaxID=453960 RepID=A0A2T2X1J2_9FIRM|nr:glutamate formimidoyltransferase [Bacillota bacterium]PSR28338.1 MAG: glutamate formimidoyltransferase [Sulfobacillus benefaciens]